ncbi:aminodeoxychorismate synthase subunit II [Erysipelotrichaceae bacterium]|nr:aminodeoxychorismate synthase subunit II [Erysipelotrichaceae bacterium]
MIVLIDNYDSFTYNIYQAIGSLNPNIRVIKNDEMGLAELAELQPSHIIFSPGSGKPVDAKFCHAVLKEYQGKCPILGICLGHQVICEASGGEISYAREVLHGKKTAIHLASGSPLFRGLPPIIDVGRYHSLAVLRETLPEFILVIAETDGGDVMAIKDSRFDIYGVQFHPESILTTGGSQIFANFLALGSEN